MRTVFKYPLKTGTVTVVPLDPLAKVRSVASQNGQPFIWIELDPDPIQGKFNRAYAAVPTGDEVPSPDHWTYVGTCHQVEGWMVFHIYERILTTRGE